MSTAGRIRQIFNADEDKLIIDRAVYDDFRFWLGGQFKDPYASTTNATILINGIRGQGVIAGGLGLDLEDSPSDNMAPSSSSKRAQV